MTISASQLVNSAILYGVNKTDIITPEALPGWFKNHHYDLLKQERGYGFYCWKPFIVSSKINQLQDGDILIYADAGQEFINYPQYVIENMTSDIFLFSNGWPHMDWCKMDAAYAIIRDKLEGIYPQTQASLIFFRVSKESREFCQEWLAWSLMPGLINNEPSVRKNIDTFQEHRWDQSILACLQIKYNIPLHWFPTTTAYHIHNDYPNDLYPAIVNHHRKRNDEWK